MLTASQREQRREALAAARVAVQAYARDPSDANAYEVELAWRRVSRIDSVARWRRRPPRAATARRVRRFLVSPV